MIRVSGQTGIRPWPEYRDVGDAILKVRQSGAALATKLAMEFMVLTAARSGEVRAATWDEIDLDERLWTVPPERMKARRAHKVPLVDRTVQIIEAADCH